MQRAVEVKTHQVKTRLGWTCNAYLVAGEPVLFVYGGMGGTGRTIFEVSSRVGSSKNAFCFLVPTTTPIAGFEPRPNRARGWKKSDDGLWRCS